MKPENILLDYNGHIALCDFGLCKLNMKENEKTNTFCGTPEYLAPEILSGNGYNKTIDWWTLGVLLYEMIHGLPPFYDENTDKMYEKILNKPLEFGDEFSEDARSILTQLLTRDPARRLGVKGVLKAMMRRVLGHGAVGAFIATSNYNEDMFGLMRNYKECNERKPAFFEG